MDPINYIVIAMVITIFSARVALYSLKYNTETIRQYKSLLPGEVPYRNLKRRQRINWFYLIGCAVLLSIGLLIGIYGIVQALKDL